MSSPIVLEADGRQFADWLSAEFSFSLDDGASSFQMSVSERWQGTFFRIWEEWKIQAGTQIKVYIHGKLALTGNVDTHESTASAEDHTVSIGGRAKTGDMVDSSIIHDGGYRWESQPIQGIAEEIAKPFGIQVTSDVDLPTIRTFQVEAGAKAWEVLRQLSERSGALIVPQPEGGVRFERASEEVLPFTLHCHQNITVRNDYSGRHSHWVGSGQRHGYDGEGIEAAQINAEVEDTAIKRYRPITVMAEGENDGITVKQIAEWRKARSVGDSLSATVTVPTFLDPDGNIWWPNTKLRIRADRHALDREMLVSAVRYSVSGSGTQCTLDLKHPASYTPRPQAKSFSASGEKTASTFNAVDEDRSLPGYRIRDEVSQTADPVTGGTTTPATRVLGGSGTTVIF